MPVNDSSDDRLRLILAEAKRVERSSRVLKQMAARELEARQRQTTSDSQEAHTNDGHQRDPGA